MTQSTVIRTQETAEAVKNPALTERSQGENLMQVGGYWIVKGIPGKESGRNKDMEAGKRKVSIS